MKNKYVFVIVLLVAILAVSMGLTTIYVSQEDNGGTREDKLCIVTSFYPMYIAVENIIGDAEHIVLTNLSEPQTGCLHDFQLTPEDMKLLSEADVFVMNGGGIETFMQSVAKAYPDLQTIEACENIHLLEDIEYEAHDKEAMHEETDEEEHQHEHEGNAHAWMSIDLYRKQVETICSHLMELDPANAKLYRANAQTYDSKLQELEFRQQQIREKLVGQRVILFHEAYAYVAEDLGLDVCYVMDLDEERAVSAGEVAEVLEAIDEHQVELVFAEELYGSSMGQTVEGESSVAVLYLDTLNRGTYDSDSYLNGMRKNLEIIEEWIAEGEYDAKNN